MTFMVQLVAINVRIRPLTRFVSISRITLLTSFPVKKYLNVRHASFPKQWDEESIGLMSRKVIMESVVRRGRLLKMVS